MFSGGVTIEARCALFTVISNGIVSAILIKNVAKGYTKRNNRKSPVTKTDVVCMGHNNNKVYLAHAGIGVAAVSMSITIAQFAHT